MNRDDFLNRKPATKTVTLESTGEAVTIRKLSAGDVNKLNREYVAKDDHIGALHFAMCRAVVDGDGKRIFTDADMTKVADLDIDIVNEIAVAAMQFSGMRQEGVGNQPGAA